MQQNWLGLRPEDLDDQNRIQLQRDLQLSAVHRAELNFGQHLENLPYLGRVVVLDDIKQYAEKMGPFSKQKKALTWLYGLPLVVVVFGMLAVLAMSNKGARDPNSFTSRAPEPVQNFDIEGEPEAISLTAWAYQSTGSRPLIVGEELQRMERLGFEVHLMGSGHVVLGVPSTGERLFPGEGELYFLENGIFKIGVEESPVYFDFRDRHGNVDLRALLCRDAVVAFPQAVPSHCVSADFSVRVAQ